MRVRVLATVLLPQQPFTNAAAVLCLAVALGTSAPSAGGRQQPPTSQRPVFTSAVDVVSVDVTVVDKYGKPVEDLGRDDFTLTVDGQVRKITSAQFVAMHGTAASVGLIPC